MKIILISIFVSLSAFAEVDWAKIYAKTKPTIPMIFASGGICAGSVINEKLILTAAHCVDKLRHVTFSFSSMPKEFFQAEVIELKKKEDLALLRPLLPIKTQTIAFVAKDKMINIGDRIATTGHPTIPAEFFKSDLIFKLDETYLFSTGVVSGKIDTDLLTDMSVSPGNSGGPAYDESGTQVGVISRKRVGLGVGQVAYVVNHHEVYKLKNFTTQENPQSLNWWKAKTSFYFNLGVGNYENFRSQNARSPQATTWSMNVDFADRVHFEYESTFDNDPGVSAYGLGWKFEFATDNKSVFYFLPQYKYQNLTWKVNTLERSANSTGLNLLMGWSAFPLSLSYYMPISASGQSSGQSSWHFVLKLF